MASSASAAAAASGTRMVQQLLRNKGVRWMG
eukprot:CAMPEP_0197530918 /NCGR_PEP_ID=MMETSP1318-20131121/33433_1 /TAXON_ID=552666 /ORGANISM="Partenskyella glossopodia, Strain RCC365" /LENGTH=30 /DNA_ID= /DNA_START= /DNA_END= /DNA_ORIENTATION=